MDDSDDDDVMVTMVTNAMMMMAVLWMIAASLSCDESLMCRLGPNSLQNSPSRTLPSWGGG